MTDDTTTADTGAEVEETTKQSSAWADIFERTAWTVIQGASATGIVAWYQSTSAPDLPGWALVPAVGLLAGLIAAVKGKLATKYGNGTAATLPITKEPVPAEDVLAKESASGVAVAGQAATYDETNTDVPMGTPVIVSVPKHSDEPDLLPDEGDDIEHVDVPIPEGGYDDGTGTILMPDGSVKLPDGTVVKPGDLS